MSCARCGAPFKAGELVLEGRHYVYCPVDMRAFVGWFEVAKLKYRA